MTLVLVKLNARTQAAVKLQEVLTTHGCDIALRLGLHEVSDTTCSDQGVIVLQVRPDPKALKSLLADLKKVGGTRQVAVKTVSF